MPETSPTLESPPPPPMPEGPQEPRQDRQPQPEQRDGSLSNGPARIRTARFGELDHHDLVHLLESLDTERERARFRESIYISLFVWLAIAWFAIYGPKVLFHQGQLVERHVADRHKDELTYLDTPPDLIKRAPKPTNVISEHTAQQQTAHPTLDKKTLEELERMRRAGQPAAAPKPAPQPAQPPQQPRPQQQAPQPQQQQSQPQQQARNQPPPAPTPQPRSAIPDAPKPSQNQGSKPIFQQPSSSAGQSIQDAARNAIGGRSSEDGDFGANVPAAHAGLKGGAEVLTDTQGVDFGPYMRHVQRAIYNAWIPLIPEEVRPPISKSGTTVIIFRINKDGSIGGMKLDDSTHDDAINRAAWGSIVSVSDFGPLPKEFTGPNLDIRFTFVITQRQVGAR